MDLFGGSKKNKKVTKTKKTSDAKKSAKASDAKKSAKASDAKKSKKSTTARSKAKGGNFLGAVGDLVAPTGWGPFATAAGLFALDRADAALRRGTKEKKEKKEKMKGGNCEEMKNKFSYFTIIRPAKELEKTLINQFNGLKEKIVGNPKYLLGEHNIDFMGKIICQGEKNFKVSIKMYCGKDSNEIIYTPDDPFNNFTTFDEAKLWLSQRKNQLSLINLALLKNHEICQNPNYRSPFNLKMQQIKP